MLRLTFCLLFTTILCAKLPSEIKVCSKTASASIHDDCLKREIENAIKLFGPGNKALGLIPLEPILITEMSNHAAGSVKVVQKYTNLTIHGFTNVKILSANVDHKNCIFDITSLNKRISATGKYMLRGQFGIFPINGNGKTNQTLENLKIHHVIHCSHYTKKDTDYLKVEKYEITFEEYDVHLQFEDLVPGNPTVSEELRSVLNENSNSIFSEVKPEIQRNYGELFRQLTEKIFSNVPYNDLFSE